MSLVFRSLRGRLLAAFLGIAMVPLTVLAVWTLLETSRTVDRITRAALLDECTLAALEFEKAMLTAQSDLFLLSQLPSLRDLLHSSPEAVSAEQRSRVATDLARVVAPAMRYAGAVYASEIGEEEVRVVRAKDTVQIVPATRLRMLEDDVFFREGRKQLGGQVLIGPLALEEPEVPASGAVVRFLTPVFDDAGRRRGALVLDLRIQGLLTQVRRTGVGAERILLVDHRSNYVEDPRRPTLPGEPPWRTDLAERYPPVAAGADPRSATLFEATDGTAVAIRPIEIGSALRPWFVATLRGADAVRAPVIAARRAFLVVLLLAIASAVSLGLMTAYRMTRPLRELAREAEELGRGRLDRVVDVRTGDEIQTLAEAMNRMGHELQVLYRGLEQRISEKTHELTEANQALRNAFDELASAHRKLQESEAELVQSEKLSSLGRLAASVAHEINNPAGIVSMYAQMLREDSTDPDARQKLDLIVSSAEKISRIVRELLDSSRRSPLEAEPVPAAAVVREALAAVLARGGEPAPDVRVDVAPDLVLGGDHAQIAQVFRNLIENAVHATAGAGPIRIAARREHDEIEIVVEDSGPGVPSDVLPRVFEPFFTTKRGGSGTGLGLFVSYGIVRSHRGSIRAENSPTGGARFIVRLPVAPPATA